MIVERRASARRFFGALAATSHTRRELSSGVPVTKNSPPDLQSAFQRARELHARGRLQEAEEIYRQLTAAGEHREAVLRSLVELYMQARRPQDAIDTLVALTEEVPDSLYYYARLAVLLDGLGHTDAAIGHYRRLLKRQPRMAGAHFNLALLYKKAKRYAEAVAAYERAIELGIGDVHEAYSNLGVLYSELRDADRAMAMYERALTHQPEYIPALFNRAGLLEEAGSRQEAVALYRRILSIDPRHWDSLGRLAHAQRITSADADLVDSLEQAIANAKSDPLAQEGLCFALGKALDDVGRYQEAFAAYRAGNELGARRNPPYDRLAVERAFDHLISAFGPDRIQASATGSTAAPIFICGMFRSGSTLVEQILAGHPQVTAGGEVDLLPWIVAAKLAPYPQRIGSASREELDQVGCEYLARLRDLHPQAANITDKRPDNFLHLGLIRILFPSARIVYTRRNALDNCLSIYFQQLGGNLNYATDLANTAHYYRQHERLMSHWLGCLGENVFTLDYDELVQAPEPVLRRLLTFLRLPWDDRCLTFERSSSLVKTASVWQVREKLHTSSSGRWRNYQPYVPWLQSLFSPERP